MPNPLPSNQLTPHSSLLTPVLLSRRRSNPEFSIPLYRPLRPASPSFTNSHTADHAIIGLQHLHHTARAAFFFPDSISRKDRVSDASPCAISPPASRLLLTPRASPVHLHVKHCPKRLHSTISSPPAIPALPVFLWTNSHPREASRLSCLAQLIAALVARELILPTLPGKPRNLGPRQYHLGSVP